MTYTVVWQSAAESLLARRWLNAADPKSFTAASDSIEKQLRERPWDVGMPLSDDRRMLIVEPFGVTYQISDDDRMVKVLNLLIFS